MGQFTEKGKTDFQAVPRVHSRFVVKFVKAQSTRLRFAPATVILVQELSKRCTLARLGSGVIIILKYKF